MNERLRVLIVDDEPLARDNVRLLLETHGNVDVIGECENGREAVETIRAEQPDLVFLDIQMPEMDGFGVVEAVGPERMPVVIFATAYDQYALKAFEAQALDYLLKPFDDDRFADALERAVARTRERRVGALSEQLVGLLADRRVEGKPAQAAAEQLELYIERVLIKSRDSVVSVKVVDVDWIEAAGDYVVLHTGKTTHLLRDTMSGMERKLDPARFVRIHRSTIVQIDRIRELRPYFHGDYMLYLHDGTELRLSRRYWSRVEGVLGGGG